MTEVLITRIFAMQARFAVACFNFGFLSALKLFSHKLVKRTGIFCVRIKKLKRTFEFRGSDDWGAMTHFYKPAYRIVDFSSNDKIRVIIDAGAHIGTETVRFRLFHSQATIISIEAERNNFEILKRNVGGDRNHILINAGLCNKNCRLRINKSGISNESFRVVEASLAEDDSEIDGVSLQHILSENEISTIDILKLDIEGAEKMLFDETANAWIGRVKVLIFECPDNDAPGTTELIYARLLQNRLRFNSYIQGENLVLIRDDVDWTLSSDLFLRV